MKIFRSWTFEWWEVSLIKLCLISLGILLNTYFHEYLAGLVPLWWGAFLLTAAYFVARFVREG